VAVVTSSTSEDSNGGNSSIVDGSGDRGDNGIRSECGGDNGDRGIICIGDNSIRD
jgi:hypothetical protein